jgi:hypothetical protein
MKSQMNTNQNKYTQNNFDTESSKDELYVFQSYIKELDLPNIMRWGNRKCSNSNTFE